MGILKNKNLLVAGFLLVAVGVSVLLFRPKPQLFSVNLTVDFGPAAKPSFSKPVTAEKGMTPKDVVSTVFPILSGKSCRSLREVVMIDGVKVVPEKYLWWICLVNGSKNVSPVQYPLKAGDRVEWKYLYEKRCPLTGAWLKKNKPN